MPSGYAHYRFGQEILSRLPEKIQSSVEKHRQLFDVGLQGPDVLFYDNPIFPSEMGKLASRLHRQTGQAFFSPAARRLREAPSEEAEAYLYGFLGHYCLDSVCHPYIHYVSDQGVMGHTEMETEFDRFLMELNGIPHPHRHDMREHYCLSRKDCVTAAVFLEPATPRQVYRDSRNMVRVNWLITMRNRWLLKRLMGLGGKVGRDMVIPENPNRKCVGTNAALVCLYRQALERYPGMALGLSEAVASGAPLGQEFVPIFG